MTDLKFAWRQVTKYPGFTAVVVLTLALGIGLNTAVFSAVEALVLRPLQGVRAPEELVQIYRTYPGGQDYGSSSPPHFLDVRARTDDVFSGASAWAFADANITANGEPQRIFGQVVSADFFTVMGVTPAQGRFFVPAEDEGRGAHPVLVLSDQGWKGSFGGDPNIVGKQVLVNGLNYDVIGIAPPEFVGPMAMVAPAFWVPLMQLDQIQPAPFSRLDMRGNNFMNVVARLKPGVTEEQALARLKAVNTELEGEFPDQYRRTSMNLVSQTEAGFHPTMRDAQVGMSAAVMAVVALLLLIACVNVANLFLARARDRAREMAIRLSLGAKRGALLRQLLVESLLYAAIAGGAGVLLAVWIIGLANGVEVPMDITFRPGLQLNPAVLGFTLGVTLLTGVLFGLVPAIQATRPSLIPALKGEAPAGGSRSRLMKSLIVAQMTASIVLLVCSGLFLTNLRAAASVDKGFVADGLVIAEFDPALQGYNRARTIDFYDRLTQRLSANPQVAAVGLVTDVPLGFSSSDRYVEIPGYVPGENEGMSIYYSSVRNGYFAAMGIPMLQGREFEAQDDSAAVPRIVVNQRFAERFWPDQEAVGRTVRTGGRDFTVIGVVPTGKYRRLGEDPTAHMWFEQRQQYRSGMNIVVRTTGDASALMGLLRQEVRAMDVNLPVANLRTMDSHLGIALLPARITGIALGVFGVLGLLLASVGMYGVMSYSVSQRTREIGIRMAIGAAGRDVIGLLMRQGLTLVVVGVGLGLVGAFAASRLLQAVLYGDGGLDLTTFTLVPLVLVAVSALATWLPARRATAVDPAITLRAD
ncbi:MAG: ABC transporter permease [Gemmatimonadaceae bacterium]|nr:ABC transporter permease [Gemmatimonadaceae bacterium]